MDNGEIIEPGDIDKATAFQLAGHAGSAVRADFSGVQRGFCTTAYSFALTYEARVYAAERVAILLEKAKGLTNDQIRALALR